MHLGARFYDVYLNRWSQPDTIVPQPENPQAPNRYGYVYQSPLKNTDPSGHCPVDDQGCWNALNSLEKEWGVDVDTEAFGGIWQFSDVYTLAQVFDHLADVMGRDVVRAIFGGVVFRAQVTSLSGNAFNHSVHGDVTADGRDAIYLIPGFAREFNGIDSTLHEMWHHIQDYASIHLYGQDADHLNYYADHVYAYNPFTNPDGPMLYLSQCTGGDVACRHAQGSNTENVSYAGARYIIQMTHWDRMITDPSKPNVYYSYKDAYGPQHERAFSQLIADLHEHVARYHPGY